MGKGGSCGCGPKKVGGCCGTKKPEMKTAKKVSKDCCCCTCDPCNCDPCECCKCCQCSGDKKTGGKCGCGPKKVGGCCGTKVQMKPAKKITKDCACCSCDPCNCDPCECCNCCKCDDCKCDPCQ